MEKSDWAKSIFVVSLPSANAYIFLSVNFFNYSGTLWRRQEILLALEEADSQYLRKIITNSYFELCLLNQV